MKIALIFPRLKYPSGEPPLGVAYLSKFLKTKTDWEVDILDTTFKSRPIEYVRDAIRGNNYNIVGISAMTIMIKDARHIAGLIKEIDRDILVVMGGPHSTVFPEETLMNRNVDVAVIGEGENALLDLCRNMGDLRNVDGIAYRDNGSIKVNPIKGYIENLDEIPYPDWELLDIENYFRHWFQLDSVSFNLRGTSIIGSRGCPFKCSYCQPVLNKLFGRRLRKRSPENIIGELSFLKQKYGLKAFAFVDDTFIVDKKWVKDICIGIKRAGLDLIWECNVRADLVDEEILQEMKDAGLRKVGIGIEAISERVRNDVYDKSITDTQINRCLSLVSSLGLKSQGYFMLGAPDESVDEMKRTVSFATGSILNEATFSLTTPLPGTNLYERSKDFIREDLSEFDYYKNYVFGEEKGRVVRKLKRIAFLRFYLSGKRIFNIFKVFSSWGGLRKLFLKLKRF